MQPILKHCWSKPEVIPYLLYIQGQLYKEQFQEPEFGSKSLWKLVLPIWDSANSFLWATSWLELKEGEYVIETNEELEFGKIGIDEQTFWLPPLLSVELEVSPPYQWKYVHMYYLGFNGKLGNLLNWSTLWLGCLWSAPGMCLGYSDPPSSTWNVTFKPELHTNR